jgi:hypothetical protein
MRSPVIIQYRAGFVRRDTSPSCFVVNTPEFKEDDAVHPNPNPITAPIPIIGMFRSNSRAAIPLRSSAMEKPVKYRVGLASIRICIFCLTLY